MLDGTGGREFDAIERIAARLGTAPPGELWIGDDAAVVRVGDGLVAIAADAVVAGVHLDLSLTTIVDAGWKAIAVNVSDLAAMGCVATRALVTVSGPPDTDLDGLYDGIAAASGHYECEVVGGDLTASPTLVISVTVLGNAAVEPPPVTRHGARAGDDLWISGPLGAAAAGLRGLRWAASGGPPVDPSLIVAHARPVARVAEGTAARELGATAMIDVSDGFGADLTHVLDASGVGVVVDHVPATAGATDAEAEGGGEDYELLWTGPPTARVVEDGFARRGLRAPIRIGRIVADPGVRLLAGRRLSPAGWTHPIG